MTKLLWKNTATHERRGYTFETQALEPNLGIADDSPYTHVCDFGASDEVEVFEIAQVFGQAL